MVERLIVVTGTGSADAAPDAVRLQLSVEAVAADPAAALTACGAAQDAVVAALGDVVCRPGPVSVEPEWDHERQRPGRPRAVSALSAVLADVATAGAAATAALAAGGAAVRLQSLLPVVQDDEAARTSARAAAFADAHAAAGHLAGLAGCSLGPVVSIAEGRSGGGPEPFGRRSATSSEGGFAVASGPLQVVAALTVTWELVGG